MKITLAELSTVAKDVSQAQEIIKEYETATQTEQKIISHYLVDGMEVADINAYLIGKSIKDIQEIILITRTAQELIEETISAFLDYLPALSEGLVTVKTRLTTGEAISKDGWLPLLDGLDWTSQLLQSLKRLELPTADLADNWREQLKEMLAAWQNEDQILLTDLIEYEILETLRELETTLKEYLTFDKRL